MQRVLDEINRKKAEERRKRDEERDAVIADAQKRMADELDFSKFSFKF